VVKFTLGSFSQGATADMTITVVPTQAGLLTNTTQVRSNERDVRPDNNSVSVITLVNP
jgi:hypothetical protein